MKRLVCPQKDFILNTINKIKDYFITEIPERELMSKTFDKYLIVLSAISGGVSIASFASVIGASVVIASASLSFVFSLTTEITKKLLKTRENKKKTHNTFAMLAKVKLNATESTISKALINNEISHEDFFTATGNEERNYRELKENIRMMKS